MSDKKRAFEGNDESYVNKKLKSDVSTSFFIPSSTNGTAPSAATSADLIAQKRAEVAAKLAAFKTSTLGWTPPIRAPIPTKPAAPIPAIAASPSSSVSSGPTPATRSTAGSPLVTDDLARRVSEAKRRVSEAQSKLAVKDNPYMSMPQTGKKKGPVEQTQQGAGLKMAAHPLLLDTTPAAPQSKKDRYKPMQPKFASIKAPSAKDTGFDGAPRERTGRNFRFNPKGKYIALATQIRQENQLEALKQRIAESARKAGLDGEMGRGPPPAAEWWDAALLPNKDYEDVATLGINRLNITTNDSPITIYIQHPIPIPAPADKNKAEFKPLMLTKKEQKKMRKLRRAQELQDKRDRIRMGLLPPDAPKVGLKNLMKVLTSDAIQDPTRVEARVRREVAQRKHGHEKMNAERKLTDEQRREKIENKKVEQEKKGIFGACFKIKVLSDPAHQFKVRKNAEQLGLTGVTIFNPQFNMVYVEGSGKAIKNYKRLLMHRMAWTEAARPRGAEDVELEDLNSDAESDVVRAKAKATLASGDGNVDGNSDDRPSLENNKCFLVWEGMLRDRAFSAFKGRSCPTDRDAKEVLGEKLKGYWEQAKNWRPEEEELF
ncbi:hypothetical protein DXG03_002501 [Asterophora parasitica]|uniref:PRP3-domain-containing protein n=1 Tax=Asterophora parasitica TaxID=117018 RepID=A0A9P7G5P4_9AGAR|nr:hypothetical protein DXG03_002501 [Asterophora parasitica]